MLNVLLGFAGYAIGFLHCSVGVVRKEAILEQRARDAEALANESQALTRAIIHEVLVHGSEALRTAVADAMESTLKEED